jgi:hypothetical protein
MFRRTKMSEISIILQPYEIRPRSLRNVSSCVEYKTTAFMFNSRWTYFSRRNNDNRSYGMYKGLSILLHSTLECTNLHVGNRFYVRYFVSNTYTLLPLKWVPTNLLLLLLFTYQTSRLYLSESNTDIAVLILLLEHRKKKLHTSRCTTFSESVRTTFSNATVAIF